MDMDENRRAYGYFSFLFTSVDICQGTLIKKTVWLWLCFCKPQCAHRITRDSACQAYLTCVLSFSANPQYMYMREGLCLMYTYVRWFQRVMCSSRKVFRPCETFTWSSLYPSATGKYSCSRHRKSGSFVCVWCNGIRCSQVCYSE